MSVITLGGTSSGPYLLYFMGKSIFAGCALRPEQIVAEGLFGPLASCRFLGLKARKSYSAGVCENDDFYAFCAESCVF
jgi:hypothetical protein